MISIQIQALPNDKIFDDSPDTCDPACFCSRCGQIIHLGQNIVRAFTGDNQEYRYHARCLGFKTEDEIECECFDDRGPVDEANEIPLGSCCSCQTNDGVRNVMAIHKKSPTPGDGCWGCFQCGLPMEGAVAVLCDPCLEAYSQGEPIRFACVGDPAQNQRIPYSQLVTPFEHDMSKHPEDAEMEHST